MARFGLFLPYYCIFLTLCQISLCTSTPSESKELEEKLSIDKNSEIDVNTVGKRDPISDNSTLGQALALARQFLVREVTHENNIITSANVELFKRSDGLDGVVTNVTTKPKLYSWWSAFPEYLNQMFKKSTTSTPQSTEEPEEEGSQESQEESTTMMPESTTTLMTEKTTVESIVEVTTQLPSTTRAVTTSIPTTTTKSPPLSETNEPQPMTPDPESEIMPPTSTLSPPSQKRTRKPRPTKRPPKTKRPSTTTESAIDTDVDTLPPLSPQVDNTAPQPQEIPPPSSKKDPFGLKRKLATFAKTVGKAVLNKTRDIAARTAPIAVDSARKLGIIALTAAGQVGNLTVNKATDAFDNLARKLNATELVDPSRNVQNSSGESTTPNSNSDQMNLDDEPCSGGQQRGGLEYITVFLGTVGLLLMNNVLN